MLNVVNKDPSQFSLLQLTHRAKHTRARMPVHARAHSGESLEQRGGQAVPLLLPEICVNERGNAAGRIFFLPRTLKSAH